MSKRLYVGNLPFSYSSSQLKDLFSPYGAIELAEVVTFKDTGRSKGFGFVTLTDDAQAEKAKADLNNKEVGGRKIFVNDATPFDPNKPRQRFKPHFKKRFNNDRGDRNRDQPPRDFSDNGQDSPGDDSSSGQESQNEPSSPTDESPEYHDEFPAEDEQ